MDAANSPRPQLTPRGLFSGHCRDSNLVALPLFMAMPERNSRRLGCLAVRVAPCAGPESVSAWGGNVLPSLDRANEGALPGEALTGAPVC